MIATRHWHASPGYKSWCGWCRYERRRSAGRFLTLLVAAAIVATLVVGIWLSALDPLPTRICEPGVGR